MKKILPTIPRLHIADIDLPREVKRLYDLAYNFWWAWSPRARQLFHYIDSATWARYRNPVQLLINFERSHWHEMLDDEAFVRQYETVVRAFDRYLAEDDRTWFRQRCPDYEGGPFAYFAMEYGIHQSLALYSGGLGVLCGDHLKSASDLGLPLVAVGLLYRHGYFQQAIDADGRQQHHYPEYDFKRLPVRPAAGHTGREVVVRVPFPGRDVHVRVWVADVGRVPLVLLDTDIATNDPADRPIASMLYTGGREMRIAQELVLGVGGVKALRALDIEPAAWHLNEGHSGFLMLERLREHVEEEGLAVVPARERIRRSTVFTTHTPVPAGNEQFEPPLIRKYLGDLCTIAGLTADELLSLGQADHGEPNQPFNLTAFALRHAAFANGVSKINAEVSRRMWSHLFPAEPAPDETIQAVTNGVHPLTWMGEAMQEVFARWLGPDWERLLHLDDARDRIAVIPDEELWAAHQAQKDRLARFTRSRLREQATRHGASPDDLRTIEQLFDPNVLTVGFARRFATYKRANLLFSDLHRLRMLVRRADRPVQFVFAGKAHPADRAGQELIQHIFQLSRSEDLRGRVIFIEDYDMRVGRKLVQGVDVWLNTPRRPLEASGTSGIKAAMNGGLNCSIADGWWPEGCDGENGWTIGNGGHPGDETLQDRDDALSLYHVLEEQVVPLYYERDEAGLPRRWVARMRRAIATLTAGFSSDRMVRDYCERAYLPAAGHRPAAELAAPAPGLVPGS